MAGAGQQPTRLRLNRPSQRAHPGASSKGQKAEVSMQTRRRQWRAGKASSSNHKTD